MERVKDKILVLLSSMFIEIAYLSYVVYIFRSENSDPFCLWANFSGSVWLIPTHLFNVVFFLNRLRNIYF
jgi:hypothetical protein